MSETHSDESRAVYELAMVMAMAAHADAVQRPHCIDCKGGGGGLIPPPVRGHDPERCHLRPEAPRWPTGPQRFYAKVALAHLAQAESTVVSDRQGPSDG